MTAPEPALFVIFGGTGDLAARKLFPALGQSAVEGLLDERTQIIGLGRKPKPDDVFRSEIRDAMAEARFTPEQAALLCDRIHYQPIGGGEPDDYQFLRRRLETLCQKHDIPQNYAFYLSLPPQAMPATITGLGEAGLSEGPGWTRLVLEKPFGKDLASARELNELVHRYFTEEQVYRIDHYLGKETVQNLLVFRLANGLIESAWNRERIASVQITVGESLGVGSRAGYYDRSGALRDMVQNHITQLLTLVAMEVPSSFDADAIRYEKIKVLRSMKPIDLSRVVRGRYTAGTCDGKQVKGYMEEPNVPQSSQTETFVAMETFVDSWRWQGVPFYLRTGKRLPKKITQIAVRFHDAPVSFFKKLGCTVDTADVLIITLQPNEGFSFHFDIKVPGDPFRLERIPLRFHYGDRYKAMPEAYQTLLLDVLNGDQTLFVHSDEVELSWKLYAPVLEQPPPVRGYAAGTWGPPEADDLAIPETDLWQGEE
jgi:glucose-6-phosphate 1-dehydrogenase